MGHKTVIEEAAEQIERLERELAQCRKAAVAWKASAKQWRRSANEYEQLVALSKEVNVLQQKHFAISERVAAKARAKCQQKLAAAEAREQALWEYAQHTPDCDPNGEPPCDCGLGALAEQNDTAALNAAKESYLEERVREYLNPALKALGVEVRGHVYDIMATVLSKCRCLAREHAAALEQARGERDLEWLDVLTEYLDADINMSCIPFPIETVKAAIDDALEQARRYLIQALGGLSQSQGFAKIGIHWDGTGSYGPFYDVWASRERDGLLLDRRQLSESELFELLKQFVDDIEEMPNEPEQLGDWDASMGL